MMSLNNFVRMSALNSSNSNNNKKKKKTMLPVLIIPGFMSSGLEILESGRKPEWKGQRIWMNLVHLGFESLYSGKATKSSGRRVNVKRDVHENDYYDMDDEEEVKHHEYKSAWLHHMALGSDMKTENDGIVVRAIAGLEGVDYLAPGMLTSHASYVFGPVIRALEKAGYNADARIPNLEAAPYDWRLPPSHLETRDSYFTRTMQQIEALYSRNNKTPVVLVCHSLGTKVCHYFLNFCKQQKGQAWINTYVHTYIPVGGPHLGAPKSVRATISGDRMGLDAFLSEEEGLRFGRSLGSGPWLYPQILPYGAPSCVHVQPQGVLEISFPGIMGLEELIENRIGISKSDRYQLVVAYGSKDRSVRTPFQPTSDGRAQSKVSFASHKIYFATDVDPSKQNSIQKNFQVLLHEPGIAAAKFFVLSADFITGDLAGGSTLLAFSEPQTIPNQVWKESYSSVVTELTVELFHKDDYNKKLPRWFSFFFKKPRTANVTVQLKWIPYDQKKSFKYVCSPVATANHDNITSQELQIQGIHDYKKEKFLHQPFTGYDILEREGLKNVLRFVKAEYDGDALGPRTYSSFDPPPIQRIHAIYGINLQTEIGAIYKRKDTVVSDGQALQNLYQLDPKATVKGDRKSHGYLAQNGILYETKRSKQLFDPHQRQVSGDGTVPYWSLRHVKSWDGQQMSDNADDKIRVSIVELDKAEHRGILADSRFHKALLDYCIRIS